MAKQQLPSAERATPRAEGSDTANTVDGKDDTTENTPQHSNTQHHTHTHTERHTRHAGHGGLGRGRQEERSGAAEEDTEDAMGATSRGRKEQEAVRAH